MDLQNRGVYALFDGFFHLIKACSQLLGSTTDSDDTPHCTIQRVEVTGFRYRQIRLPSPDRAQGIEGLALGLEIINSVQLEMQCHDPDMGRNVGGRGFPRRPQLSELIRQKGVLV